MFKTILCTVVVLLSAMCFGSSKMTILVVHDLASRNIKAPLCRAELSIECVTDIDGLSKIVEDSKFMEMIIRYDLTLFIEIEEGEYRLKKALNINWPVKSRNNSLAITGLGHVVFSGAHQISTLYPVDIRANSGFSPDLNKNVFAAVVKNILPNTYPVRGKGFDWPVKPLTTELFIDNKPMPLARWPNKGYAKIIRPDNLAAADKVHFSVEGQRFSRWAAEANLSAYSYWFHDWASETLPIDVVNLSTGVLELSGKGSLYGIKNGQRIVIENALSELDEEGEWYLAGATGVLYFIPLQSDHLEKIEISVAENLMVIRNSSYINITNINFEKARGDAIICENCNQVVFDKVNARFAGNRAFVFRDSKKSGVKNSKISDMGEGGIALSGGDRLTLEKGENFVRNSTIKNYSRFGQSYRYAVSLGGVGQIVSGNYLSEGSHAAIHFLGNDHLIENNYISDVVLETSDAGAIYSGQDLSSRGTVISNNFFIRIGPQNKEFEVKGIYLDDLMSGISIRKNIFVNVQQPVFIGGGRDNLIEDNIFIHSSPPIHLDARGVGSKPTLEQLRALSEVSYKQHPYAAKYIHLSSVLDDDFGKPKYNIARRNIVIGGDKAQILPGAASGIFMDDFFRESDTVFLNNPQLDASKPTNYMLAPNSRAVKKGFQRGNLLLIPYLN